MDPDREGYRRRQRRRAMIGWTSGLLIVAVFVLAIVLGGRQHQSGSSSSVDIFAAEMSSSQYEAIHKGEGESLLLNRLGGPGLQEDEVQESELLGLFPARPGGSVCSYWALSDSPDHLVRLCFSGSQGVLLQKSVAAAGDDEAPTTLV